MSVLHNHDGFQIDENGYAESSADVLADFLAEHGDDPAWGDPADWSEWTDHLVVALGPDLAHGRDHDHGDLDEPPVVYEPSDEDIDALERFSYERHCECNARFV